MLVLGRLQLEHRLFLNVRCVFLELGLVLLVGRLRLSA
jgi:hypothetical protein